MKEQLETLVRDVLALDPDLVEKETEVRALIVALADTKPHIIPDEAFVRSLRDQLLSSAADTKPKLVPGLPLWMVYVAPVGAVAVLVLMLLPGQPVEAPTMEEGVEIGATHLVPDADAPREKRSGAPTDEAVSTFSQLALPTDPVDTFALAPQEDGRAVVVEFAAVLAPSYLVVHSINPDGTPGEIMGVSELLTPDNFAPTTIVVTPGLVADTLYTAILYRDNGDQVFTVGKDQVVYDGTGEIPQQQVFSIPAF